MSFTEANRAFKSGNTSEALMKYTMAFQLYEKIDNHFTAGIIANNIGNIHMKLDKFDEAIQQYRIAINLGEKCLKTRMESKISRRLNLTLALRSKFYQ